jgi:hypothetical protein
MNGVTVRVIGSRIVVEVDILKAIAEGIGGGRPISTVKPGPKPKTSKPVGVVSEPRDALVVCHAARAGTFWVLLDSCWDG